ncbi:unnamed protein product [Arabis nemorensis]|uniref:Uncharacterized protein n=1 Tax=Arabis nemorensis TaxID=586526 RepID=A0A565BVB8_9BRAS|nr:unnamed protein product [Arabis nemorensis]
MGNISPTTTAAGSGWVKNEIDDESCHVDEPGSGYEKYDKPKTRKITKKRFRIKPKEKRK